MINKCELKGKHVSFVDKNGATRICKVYRVSGNTLTVGQVMMIRRQKHRLHWERIHPEHTIIHGVYQRNKIEEINWGRKNNGNIQPGKTTKTKK